MLIFNEEKAFTLLNFAQYLKTSYVGIQQKSEQKYSMRLTYLKTYYVTVQQCY